MSDKRMGETGEQYRARLASEGSAQDAQVEAVDEQDEPADKPKAKPRVKPRVKGKAKAAPKTRKLAARKK